MDKLVLTNDKLQEILHKENDDCVMESYYQIALKGDIVADQHMAIVAFLLILIRYKRRRMLGENACPFHFFGVPQDDYGKYYELLERTNLEIFKSIVWGEDIPDRPLVEFSEDHAFLSFWKNEYFSCLRSCDNALSRNKNSFICNFIKASIVELCCINKTTDTYKIQLANYQKRLIEKCDEVDLNFNKDIYRKVVEIVNKQYKYLDERYQNINFTKAKDTFELTQSQVSAWTKEHDFCLRNRLFLNPLCDFDLFLESSYEELQPLNIAEEKQVFFNEIIEEFKLCRHLTFEYIENRNDDIKRVQCMVFSYAYTIFDKIAFLFKDVYDIDVGDDKVGFTKNNLFDRKFRNIDLRFRDVKNSNIYPLFDIMQKVRSKQKITDAIKAVVFDFHELRNKIEHRTTLDIDDAELRVHSIYLLKVIKETILYAYMLMHSFSGENGTHKAYTTVFTTYSIAIQRILEEQKGRVEQHDQL